ncbi:Tachykinin-like peptides receptor 99D [Trichoplax sp. H2]|nr:Tachykinin-like peptides receptor 99D [Trichoplax sp. H2]|eukprot:RDD36675.1 Tachykinin-like peptides receptor 99D [Trichoplax sp. H2]
MVDLFSHNISNSNAINNIYNIIYDYASLISGVLSIIGCSLNLFLLYILIRDKQFHGISYKLIRISVISDILSSFTIGTGCLLISYEFTYDGGVIGCRVVLFFTLASHGVSMLNLCLIAIDRYFAIVKPLYRRYHRRRKQIFYLSQIFVWTISASYTGAVVPAIKVSHEDPTLCDLPDIAADDTIPIRLIIIVTVQYVIPCTGIAIIYFKIISHQRNYVRPGQSTFRKNENNIRKQKFINMLISITLCYILITWPFNATLFGLSFTRKTTTKIRKENLSLFLLTFYSLSVSVSVAIINPIVYLKFDGNIRQKVLKIFRH